MRKEDVKKYMLCEQDLHIGEVSSAHYDDYDCLEVCFTIESRSKYKPRHDLIFSDDINELYKKMVELVKNDFKLFEMLLCNYDNDARIKYLWNYIKK